MLIWSRIYRPSSCGISHRASTGLSENSDDSANPENAVSPGRKPRASDKQFRPCLEMIHPENSRYRTVRLVPWSKLPSRVRSKDLSLLLPGLVQLLFDSTQSCGRSRRRV